MRLPVLPVVRRARAETFGVAEVVRRWATTQPGRGADIPDVSPASAVEASGRGGKRRA
jgi:hypothetical protein